MRTLFRLCIFAFVMILCLDGVDAFAQQATQSYANARDLYNRYDRNQQVLNQINQRIRMNELRLKQIRRDYANVSYSSGSGGLGGGMYEEASPVMAALERDRILAAQMERKQYIIEQSFNKHYKNYYGHLKSTYNQTVYDSLTGQNVNLMESRINRFQNPDGNRSVQTTSKDSPATRYTGSSGKYVTPKKITKTKYTSSSTRSTPKQSSTGHTMTLTPVK